MWGRLGTWDHGKTTLTSAITEGAGVEGFGELIWRFDQIDKAPEKKERGLTIAIAPMWNMRRASGPLCAYRLSGAIADYIKNMITGRRR